MLKTELKTASNIKNKQNRHNVETSLKLIMEKLKLVKANQLGIYIFSGITRDQNEIFEMIIPKIPSSLSYYRCDNKFHTWIVEDVISNDESQAILLVLIYGNQCIIFKCTCKQIIKVYTHGDPTLVKRHGSGGSSSNRYARIADESRQHYVDAIQNKVWEIYLEQKLPVVLDGGRELVGDLKAVLEKRQVHLVYTLDIFHEYKPNLITQNMSIIKKTIDELFDKTEKTLAEFIENFTRFSDQYLVGREEIETNLSEIELIVCLSDYRELDDIVKYEKQILQVPITSKQYAQIKKFEGILAKKFY